MTTAVTGFARIGHLTKIRFVLNAIKRIFLALFVLCLWGSCKQKDAIEEDQLFGKWNITKAERNGNETPYLRGGYFVINKDGKILVNISGNEEAGTYVFDHHVIRTNDDRRFNLKTLKADSMILQFTASPQSEFVFYMIRQHDFTQ